MDILVESLGNSSNAPLLGVNDFLKTLNPFLFSGIGVAFAIALSACGAAWGIALVGSALTGHAVARPHVRTRNIVRYKIETFFLFKITRHSVVFCEAVAIFGIIAALLSRLTMQIFSVTPAEEYVQTVCSKKMEKQNLTLFRISTLDGDFFLDV